MSTVYSSIAEMTARRRELWEQCRDTERDRVLVRAAAQKLLSDEALRGEIEQRPYLLIELCFTIVDKHRQSVPFFFNEVQRDFIGAFEKHGTEKPYVILKGRQQGFTSLITAMQLSYAIVRKNFSGFTLADCTSNTQTIFNDKARTVYAGLPPELKPTEKFNSMKELFFSRLNSSWRVATAAKQTGRSKTLNFVHFSEAAFYKCPLSALQRSVGEAMTVDAFCVYESTANGFNEFKELWDSGDCVKLFYGWWRTEEYRSLRSEPVEIKDKWLSERIGLLERLGLEREQIAWYCEKYRSYLDKSSIRQEFPCTPEEAFIASGDCIFDKDAIYNRLVSLSAAPPPRTGSFSYKRSVVPVLAENGEIADMHRELKNIEFVESADGYIRIHEEPRVKRDTSGNVIARAPYAIGGDTAGAGEDYYTAKVICRLDGRTVATLQRQRIDEDLYAEQLYCLGRYYNNALIGIETNYSRYPMRLLAESYSYPSLYLRERTDALTSGRERVYGFETTARTKPQILSELVAIMRDCPELETDIPTLREMTSFVRKANGRQEAISGEHDDLVMALAIAHFISKQQVSGWIREAPEENDFLRRNFRRAENNSEMMNWEDF